MICQHTEADTKWPPFPDDICKCIFLNENVALWISIKISLKFVPKGLINIIPALNQIMSRRRPGDKPMSEPTIVGLLTHLCITRPQWVKKRFAYFINWHVTAYIFVRQVSSLSKIVFEINPMAAGRWSNNQIQIDVVNVAWELLSCECHRTHWWWARIGLGNGLVPSDNKPLPEPMLTLFYVAILIKIMVCRLVETKLLSEPMMGYC